MTRTFLPLLALALLACGDDKPEDTSAPDDTAPASGTAVTFNVNGEWQGTSLDLTPFTLTDGTYKLGTRILIQTMEGATQQVVLADPTADALVELDPTNAPGMMGNFYIPALFKDDNASATLDAGEFYVGVGDALLAWLEEPSGIYASAGAAPGWNALQVRFGDPNTLDGVVALTGVTLSSTLWPRGDTTIGGTWAATTAPAGLRMAVVSELMRQGSPTATLVYDDILTTDAGTWSLTLAGAPEDDHLMEAEGFGRVAMENPVAYTDNGNGAFDGEDMVAAITCANDGRAQLMFVPNIMTPDAAYRYRQQGVRSGWQVLGGIREGAAPQILDETQSQALVFQDNCSTR